jgi:predicted small integral membrane protein
MRCIKQLMLVTALITGGLCEVEAQDVSINILNQPAAVSKGSTLGRVLWIFVIMMVVLEMLLLEN